MVCTFESSRQRSYILGIEEVAPLNISCSKIGTTAEELKIIQELLEQHLSSTDAWIYDSTKKCPSTSKMDLNLVVLSAPEQEQEVNNLREALEERNLPLRVDLIEWNDLSEKSQNRIKDKHELSQLRLASGKYYSIIVEGPADYCYG